ncbi:hypothetical protein U9M48_005205 [Paspalum notatum var. saurae]|uniref:RING-type domain-containing protein n=1 Tax=Paspalum notatum var. saurae TaxID=547442 RepID=A0AAQ3PQB1_PASNO
MVPGVSSSLALALAGFCFSLLFIAFVCSRLACALLRRHRRRRRARRAPDGLPPHYAAYPAALPRAAAAAGLDPAAIAAFPTRAAQADDDSQCVICLAEYEEKELLRILPYCGHNFHMACIDLWLEQNSTCPVCRISLVEDPDDSDHTAPPPPPVPSVVISISPPSSPESSMSDPCRCLFGSAGHSSRALDVPRHEQPDQENQVASGPSADGADTNSMPLSEVKPPS